MKKILFLLTASVALLAACSSDDAPTKKTKGQLDPNALVTLSPAAGVQIRAVGDADSDTPFPAVEVVRRAHSVNFYTHYINSREVEPFYSGVGFADVQKDYETGKLKFWGTWIIDQDGRLVKSLLYGDDFVIVGGDPSQGYPAYGNSTDTLGYIPNAVITAARAKIEKAYSDSNYTEVYRLFDDAFTYIPCTAKQYKELKAKGLN